MSKKKEGNDLLKPFENKLKWIVLIVSFLVYANTLNHQFALDDYSVIMEHDHVQAGTEGIDEILSTNYRHGQVGFNDGLYRPLSLLTFALEKSWFNSDPSIGHLINILLYAIGCSFLFLSLKNIFSDQALIIPLGISLLFITHPLHTEVVANIKSRDELLAFFGLALSLYFFLKAKGNLLHLSLAVLFLIIALFSKESAIVYAVFIPLLIYLKDDVSLQKAQTFLLITLPFAVLFILLRNHIINSMENPVDPGNFGLLNNPIAATSNPSLSWGSKFALQLKFLIKLIFPVELIHDYSYNQIPLVKLFHYKSLSGILILLPLAFLSVMGIFKKNIWGIIALLYVLTIIIASQLLMPIGVHFAERLLFLAVLPFAIAVVLGLKKLLWKRKDQISLAKQKSLLLIVLIISGLYSFKTVDRNADWENNFTLYQADIEAGKNSARVNYNYGTTLSEVADQQSGQQKQQSLQAAIKYLNRAVDIYPDYLDAWNNLGIANKKAGKREAARNVFIQNISRDPDYAKNYYNLGTLYYEDKQYRKAIQALDEYTSRQPNAPSAYMLMAQAAGNLQSFGEAISFLNANLQYQPNNVDAYNMLGMAYGSTKQFEKAQTAFNKAMQLAPNRTDVMMNMAINYNQQGNTSAEIKMLKRILELDPQNNLARNQLNNSLQSQANK